MTFVEMTNAEKVLEFIEGFGAGCCDDCISERAGVEPRNQVNQIALRLEKAGILSRSKAACGICGRSKKVNLLVARGDRSPRVAVSPSAGPTPPVGAEELRNRLDRFCKKLRVKCASAGAANGLAALITELSNNGVIPLHQANMMHTIRALRNAYVHEHIEVGTRERAILENAWAIIAEWAERCEPEAWRQSR